MSVLYEHDGVVNIRAAVMAAFRQLGRGMRCMEVGVKDGSHAKIILDLLCPSSMILVDLWEDVVIRHDTYCAAALEQCRTLLLDYPQCLYLKGRSQEVLPTMPADSLDFAYIDAAHDHHSVTADVRNCVRLVRVGGIVGGHDYAVQDPLQDVALGVRTALRGVPIKRDGADTPATISDWWTTVTPEMKELVRVRA